MNNEQSDPVPLRLGEQLDVTIEALAAGGDGIARPNGFTLFVPRTVPGDVASVEVTHLTKSWGRARLLAIRQPGVDRVPVNCPLAEGCPGCQLQHLRYEAQLRAKETFVRDGLERIGHIHDFTLLPTLGMDDPWHYRNKGEFIARTEDGKVQLGYVGDEREFVPLGECPIHHPLSIEVLHAVEEVATAEGLPLAQLITRVSPSQGEALAILVCWDWHDRLPAAAEALQERIPALAGVLWSRVRGRSVARRTLAESLTGRTTLLQHLGAWDYNVSAESFFQVNNIQATRLLGVAEEFAAPLEGKFFGDAYCGVGTFLLPLSGKALRAYGIEEHPIALHDAERNLARYARHDTTLYAGHVETILARQVRKGRSVDVMLLDPPRKGAGPTVLELVAQLGAEKVILVSCDPATLGRDTGDLVAHGYRVDTVQPIDMFPQTWHVETIARLVRE